MSDLVAFFVVAVLFAAIGAWFRERTWASRHRDLTRRLATLHTALQARRQQDAEDHIEDLRVLVGKWKVYT